MSEDAKGPHIPLGLSMDDPAPIYEQIESQLRDFILAGALSAGTKLPSVRALSGYLGCSVLTTRRAYEDLEREGFILTRQGIGSVVARIPEEKMAAHRREPFRRALGEAVGAARRAGLTEEELREIVEETLRTDDTGIVGGKS
jgi:DNA-binding transcriptional regulator YhcF (GntR family)